MQRFRFYITLLLSLSLSLPMAAHAGRLTQELRTRLAQSYGDELLPVLIHFSDRVDVATFAHRSDRRSARAEMIQALKDKSTKSQGPLRAFLRSQGVKDKELWIVNALAAEVPAPLVDILADWPGVAVIESDSNVPAPSPVPLAQPLAPPTWNILATGAPALWSDGFTGTGVTIATLDTGVNPNHPDLAGKFRDTANDWEDPFDGSLSPSDFTDGSGLTHGTAVTSLILGGENSGNAIGMAPDAQWIAARIFHPSTATNDSHILVALQWALNHSNPPDIVNNSWGFENAPDQCLNNYQAATAALQAAGIHVVYAAGNTGPDPETSVSPANNPEGFAAGAVGQDLIVSRLSARGPSACGDSIYTPHTAVEVFPELLAPGDGVLVANGVALPHYVLAAGSSLSAPHVTGALALLRQAIPPGVGQSASDYRLALELALLNSTDDLGPLGPDNDHGYGLLNVDAAYLRLSGQPHLALHTPGAPENDAIVDFGNIPPLTSAGLNLTLTNNGGAPLTFTNIQTNGITPPFELLGNDCPTTLASDATCTLTLRFAPATFGSFSDQLQVQSDDPRTPNQTVTLQGIGNSPPPPAVLIAPADGASIAATSVTLTWNQGEDADGDPLSQTLIWADNPIFFPSTSTPVAMSATGSKILIAGTGLLLTGFALRRSCSGLLLLLLASVLYLATACGGGGGGSGLTANFSHTLDNLDVGTTYYWKVRTDDGNGGVVESSVRSFSIR